MTKEKIRAALASVLGFRPVNTVRHKLLVISVPILRWGLFLILPLFIFRIRIPDVSFYYRQIINKSLYDPTTAKIPLSQNLNYFSNYIDLHVLYHGRHLLNVVETDHL